MAETNKETGSGLGERQWKSEYGKRLWEGRKVQFKDHWTGRVDRMKARSDRRKGSDASRLPTRGLNAWWCPLQRWEMWGECRLKVKTNSILDSCVWGSSQMLGETLRGRSGTSNNGWLDMWLWDSREQAVLPSGVDVGRGCIETRKTLSIWRTNNPPSFCAAVSPKTNHS